MTQDLHPIPAEGIIHVWTCSLEPERADAGEYLSKDERDKARRFHFARDKNRYIQARSFLRKTLSNYINAPAECLAFCYGTNGKPELQSGSRLKFNLSHSHDFAACAITMNRQIGIDVEAIAPLPDLEAVAGRFFLPDEIHSLKELNPSEKLPQFYKIWTRGEALLKWSGTGLVEPAERGRMLETFDGTIIDLDLGENFKAAVAVSGPVFEVRLCH